MTTNNSNENTIIGQIEGNEQAFLASPTINYTKLGKRFGATFDTIQLFIERFCLGHPGVFVTNGHLVDMLMAEQACLEEAAFTSQYDVDAPEEPHAWNCDCPLCWIDDQPF